MAVVRTVLPRKGIIEPQHGNSYETDLDTNWQIIDSQLQSASDVQAAIVAAGTVESWLLDRGLSGVSAGFGLSTSPTLAPGLALGVLYAQGVRYAPAAVTPPAAPASATSFLWYNSASGFYYNLTGIAAANGDAYLGTVTTSATAVTAVVSATRLYGLIPITSSAAGFSAAHNLGRTPLGALIYMTSPGAIWFQWPTMFDGTKIYLVGSDAGLTAQVQIW